MTRPRFVRHWRELEAGEQVRSPTMNEPFGFVAELAAATELAHLRCAHIRLPPGVRSHPPIAARDEDGFFFVLEGTPDLWLDGYQYRLGEGDAVCLPARTGIAHALLNNSRRDTRLFFCGEGLHVAARFGHPVDAAAAANLRSIGKLWEDAPAGQLGPHDGLTDLRRAGKPPKGSRRRGRPDAVLHWRDLLQRRPFRYEGSREQHVLDAAFSQWSRMSRLGVHVQLLAPGRRSSFPHAERDEEEFVFVVAGTPQVWNDGHVSALVPGDFVGWDAGTGIAHCVLNNSAADVVLIVGGEAGRIRGEIHYPYHPERNKALGTRWWRDAPQHLFGPHDGLPDRLRRSAARAGRTRSRTT